MTVFIRSNSQIQKGSLNAVFGFFLMNTKNKMHDFTCNIKVAHLHYRKSGGQTEHRKKGFTLSLVELQLNP